MYIVPGMLPKLTAEHSHNTINTYSRKSCSSSSLFKQKLPLNQQDAPISIDHPQSDNKKTRSLITGTEVGQYVLHWRSWCALDVLRPEVDASTPYLSRTRKSRVRRSTSIITKKCHTKAGDTPRRVGNSIGIRTDIATERSTGASDGICASGDGQRSLDQGNFVRSAGDKEAETTREKRRSEIAKMTRYWNLDQGMHADEKDAV
jgi:hypothetical protein